MKKIRIVLIVFLLLFMASGAFAYYQYDNIKALYYSYRYSQEDLENMIQKNDQDLQSFIDTHKEVRVRIYTPEEEKAHQNGLITDAEMKDILTGKTTLDALIGYPVTVSTDKKHILLRDGKPLDIQQALTEREEQKKIAATQPQPPTQSQSMQPQTGTEENVDQIKIQEEISQYIAQMYVLKSSYCGQLDSLYNQAIADYKALPKEQRKEAKRSIANKYYSSASSMEEKCDSQVESVLANLKTALQKSKEDNSIVTTIREAYNNEKCLKKAYYVNLYTN